MMWFVFKENGGEGWWFDRNGDDFVIFMFESAYVSIMFDFIGEWIKEVIDVVIVVVFCVVELYFDFMDEVEEKEFDMNM